MLNTPEWCRPGVRRAPGRDAKLLFHERSSDPMLHDTDHRLVCWLTPPQAVEGDRAPVQVDLRTHQPVGPAWIDRERLAQHLHLSLPVGPTQVDQAATQRLSQTQLPVLG